MQPFLLIFVTLVQVVIFVVVALVEVVILVFEKLFNNLVRRGRARTFVSAATISTCLLPTLTATQREI